MLFSLITPVLNGERFLGDAIATIRSQAHENFEYFIVDGGSTDKTLAIARQAAAEDERIKVMERPNLKQYPAIAHGLKQSRGQFVAWLNADDLYAPWALSAVARAVKNNPDIRWLSGLPACWDEHGVLRFVRADSWRPRELIRRGWFHKNLLGYIQQESIFFARDLFAAIEDDERNAFENAELAGDFILWKSFARKAPLITLPTVLGGFRRHRENKSLINADAYFAEARKAGAILLPSPIAAVARALYWRASSLNTARLAQHADKDHS